MEKARVIMIDNGKTGGGNTIIAVNLAAMMAKEGNRTLVIDTNPNGNLTKGLGIEDNTIDVNLYDVLENNCDILQAVMKTKLDNLKVIASNIKLGDIECENSDLFKQKQLLFKTNIDKLRDEFDFIIIDSSVMNFYYTGVIIASDSVLIPIDINNAWGVEDTLKTYENNVIHLNPNLEIEGIVFVKYDAKTNQALNTVEELKKRLGGGIDYYVINNSVKFVESVEQGLSIFDYDSKAKATASFKDFALHVIYKYVGVGA